MNKAPTIYTSYTSINGKEFVDFIIEVDGELKWAFQAKSSDGKPCPHYNVQTSRTKRKAKWMTFSKSAPYAILSLVGAHYAR